MFSLACCSILQDNDQFDPKTLDSVKGLLRVMLVYIINGTEERINELKKIADEYQLVLYYISGPDTVTIRNELIIKAASINSIQYLLFLDNHHILWGGEYLQSEIKRYEKHDILLIRYEEENFKWCNVGLLKKSSPWRFDISLENAFLLRDNDYPRLEGR